MTSSYHLIGIGGAGMSVVAQLLKAEGFQVSGSDQQDSSTLQELLHVGIDAYFPHDPGHMPSGATVVLSSAIREDNPELLAARTQGAPVIHRSEALARAAQGKRFVAVAGAHGKTTTSAMLATALDASGCEPSFAIGGIVTAYATGAHIGAGDIFVAEADESDGSFLNYEPTLAIVTNVEADHLDHWGSQEAFEQGFVDFAMRVRKPGCLVICVDDPGAARLLERLRACGFGDAAALGSSTQVATIGYGLSEKADIRITDLHLGQLGSSAVLRGNLPGFDGLATELSLQAVGQHNVLNATAAWVAGLCLGAAPQSLAQGLHSFTGTARRFDVAGSVAGIRVIDDYAHHPTEVASLMRQARLAAGANRVLAVFQPHLFSRTKQFATQFAQALSQADKVVLTDIYGAREDPIEGVSSHLIADQLPGAQVIDDMFEAGDYLADLAQPSDIILTIGAGSITKVAPAILARLSKRRGEGLL